MSLPTDVKAVIFDLDGTIIDTESLCIDISREVVARHGKKLTQDVIKVRWAKPRSGARHVPPTRTGAEHMHAVTVFPAGWRTGRVPPPCAAYRVMRTHTRGSQGAQPCATQPGTVPPASCPHSPLLMRPHMLLGFVAVLLSA